MVGVLTAALVGSAIAGGVYSAGKGFENQRYWDDYYKNTHRRPKYRFRSGYNNTFGYYSSAVGRFARVKRW